MKRLINLAAMCSCLMGSAVAVAAPDLIVEQFARNGEISERDGRFYVPVTVKVKNQGNKAATSFKLAVDYWRNGQQYAAPFSVSGQSSLWYPFAPSLASGKSISFQGNVIIRIDAGAEGTIFKVEADSCSGDELMPEFCRIKENDEGNNSRNLYVIF